ncbi:MAG: hypothetical protein ACE5GE_06720 [Phycisphaerae bacterium]
MQVDQNNNGERSRPTIKTSLLRHGVCLSVFLWVGGAHSAFAQSDALSVSPPFANAFGESNAETPTIVALAVSGSATQETEYRITWLPRSWFTLDKTEGIIPASGSDAFNVLFNPFGLVPGSYTAQLNVENVTVPGNATVVALTLTVTPGGIGSVTLVPDEDLEVAGPAGHFSGGDVQNSTLFNASDQSVLWRAVVSDPWVSVSPEGGELASNGQVGDTQTLEIRVNAAVNDLPAGSHVATITFENITAGVPPVSFEEISTAIPIGTRLVRIVANPVLTISNDSGGGSVDVQPGGEALAEESAGQFVYEQGQAVTLLASPEDGFQFTGWVSDVDEDLPLDNPLVLSMDVSRTINAGFGPIRRALTLSTTGSGAGSVSRTPTGAIEDNDLSALYDDGTNVTVSAQANPGSRFGGWEGNVPAARGQDNPVTVRMDRDRVIAARFEPEITLEVSSVGEGEVTVEPDLASYDSGAQVTLTANPQAGAAFLGWSGDAEGTQTPLTVTLDEGKDIVALFGPESGADPGDGSGGFELVVEIVGDGTVTPDGGSFAPGRSVMLIATPGVGSGFIEWGEDAAGKALTTTILMDGDRMVRAVFEASETPAPRNVGVGSGSGGSSSMCGSVGSLGVPVLALGLLGWVRLTGRRRLPRTEGKHGQGDGSADSA